jgi:hypothetical protein
MSTGRRVALDSTIAWEAVRSSGGSLATAARALRITPTQLIEMLRADPPCRLIDHRTSGLRRRVDESDNET